MSESDPVTWRGHCEGRLTQGGVASTVACSDLECLSKLGHMCQRDRDSCNAGVLVIFKVF